MKGNILRVTDHGPDVHSQGRRVACYGSVVGVKGEISEVEYEMVISQDSRVDLTFLTDDLSLPLSLCSLYFTYGRFHHFPQVLTGTTSS